MASTVCSAARYKARVIRVSHLTKRYGATVAVDDVSFEIGRGEVVGFLGPNGAGKSSTLRILAGFLGPTAGRVTIGGYDITDDSLEARRCIGYMPEAVPLYPEMRVVEYLRFRAELKRVPRARRTGHVDDAMRRSGVIEVAHRRIAHLSKGYRQRVGLADALVAKPPILILDEPTAGLDPNQIRETRALIRELGREATVVVSTHVLSEVEACATRVLLIHRGKLIAQGTTEAIRALRLASGVEIAVHSEPVAAERALASVDGIARIEQLASHGGIARIRATFDPTSGGDERARATERAIAALVASGLGVREVRSAGGSLEDAFASLTQDTPEDAAS